jgi:hypothetical protein
VYRVHWDQDQAFGAIGLLDLLNQNQVGSLFRLPQPKLLLMYDEATDPGQDVYEAAIEAAMPLAKDLLGRVKIYLCPASTCRGALDAFGLAPSNLPRAVIDDNHRGNKFVAEEKGFDEALLRRFLLQSLPSLSLGIEPTSESGVSY